MDSYVAAEFGGLLLNSQTTVPIRITPNEVSFTKLINPIKADNYAAKGIFTSTVIQKKV